MRFVDLLIFFGLSVVSVASASKDVCPDIVKKELVSSVKKKSPHSFFTRCHPTLPLGFSNENQPEGSASPMIPVVINLKTAKKTELKLEKGEFAEDLTPTPDGKFLVTQITTTGLNALGLYRVDDKGKIERVGLLENKNDRISQNFFYPSIAIRDNEYLVAVRTFYRKNAKSDPSEGIFLNKIKDTNGEFKTEAESLVCSNIEEFDLPYISLDGSLIGGSSKGEMGIYRIDWDKKQGNEIPCTLVRKLPSTAGKVSFSPSNRFVVFHADELSSLGQTKSQEDNFSQSYLMDIKTGQLTRISKVRKGMSSEFPFFCSEEQVLMRSVRYGKRGESIFDLANIKINPNQDCLRQSMNSSTESIPADSAGTNR